MKQVFELDYPDGAMITAAMLQETLCKHWAMPVYVRDVTQDDKAESTDYNTAQLRILRALANGHHVSESVYTWKRMLSDGPTIILHADFAVLHNDDLVMVITRSADSAPGFNYYTISDAGRAVLAEHE